MTASKRRAAAAAVLSSLSIAFVGVGALTPAQASEAGVNAQQLKPASLSPARVSASVDAAALPTVSRSALRWSVDSSGVPRRS